MITVTFDTNVLLSATLWDGSVAQKLLFDLIKQNVTIYSTIEILSEYQKILKRDFDFSDEEMSEILEKVLLFVTLVNPKTKLQVVKEDPDDNIILEYVHHPQIVQDIIMKLQREYTYIRQFKETGNGGHGAASPLAHNGYLSARDLILFLGKMLSIEEQKYRAADAGQTIPAQAFYRPVPQKSYPQESPLDNI